MTIKKLNLAQLGRLMDKGARLYDMRDAVAFRDGTLEGAQHLVLRRIAELFSLPKKTHIILFGTGYDDPEVVSAINYLDRYGYFNIYNLGSKETK